MKRSNRSRDLVLFKSSLSLLAALSTPLQQPTHKKIFLIIKKHVAIFFYLFVYSVVLILLTHITQIKVSHADSEGRGGGRGGGTAPVSTHTILSFLLVTVYIISY